MAKLLILLPFFMSFPLRAQFIDSEAFQQLLKSIENRRLQNATELEGMAQSELNEILETPLVKQKQLALLDAQAASQSVDWLMELPTDENLLKTQRLSFNELAEVGEELEQYLPRPEKELPLQFHFKNIDLREKENFTDFAHHYYFQFNRQVSRDQVVSIDDDGNILGHCRLQINLAHGQQVEEIIETGTLQKASFSTQGIRPFVQNSRVTTVRTHFRLQSAEDSFFTSELECFNNVKTTAGINAVMGNFISMYKLPVGQYLKTIKEKNWRFKN